jgi:phosphoglycolate phosphatase-like HAD superfamily hydrolase
MNASELLPRWNQGGVKNAVLEFVESVTEPGASYVAPAERIATFDNDGTLWCEKPMPIQFDFILRRLSEMAQADPGLRGRQPWKAAYERDYGWFGTVINEHYAGNDADVGTLMAGILAAYKGISVEDFEAKSGAFLRTAQHPTLGRGYLECVYAPMVELLGYLEANGFTNYIVSGGGRDFMRPVSQEVYGIPRDRVIGSASTFQYTSDDHGGTITHKAEADVLDDGPQKTDPDLEPHRPAAAACRRQLQRRHPDARFHLASRQAVRSPAPPPRRRPARVRLHQRRRTGTGAGWQERLDGGEHARRLQGGVRPVTAASPGVGPAPGLSAESAGRC